MTQPIITITQAYETFDGKKFHDVTEAQDHTKTCVYSALIDRAVKANVKYAHLDKALLIEFLKERERDVAIVSHDPLTPVNPQAREVEPKAPTAFRPDPLKSAAVVHPKFMEPVAGESRLATAMNNVDRAFQTQPKNAEQAIRAEEAHRTVEEHRLREMQKNLDNAAEDALRHLA